MTVPYGTAESPILTIKCYAFNPLAPPTCHTAMCLFFVLNFIVSLLSRKSESLIIQAYGQDTNLTNRIPIVLGSLIAARNHIQRVPKKCTQLTIHYLLIFLAPSVYVIISPLCCNCNVLFVCCYGVGTLLLQF